MQTVNKKRYIITVIFAVFAITSFLVWVLFSKYISSNSDLNVQPEIMPTKSEVKPTKPKVVLKKPKEKPTESEDELERPEGDQMTTDSYFQSTLNSDHLLVQSPLSWFEFSQKLQQDDDVFVEEFTSLFSSSTWSGVFFECKPIKPATSKTDKLEFRLIGTKSFNNVKAHEGNFKEKFLNQCPKSNQETVISFMNLSKTSLLIVPCPSSKITNNAHIKAFMSTASIGLRKLFLKQVGHQLEEALKKNSTIFLSTHGLGEYWLHVRLDPSPKYYSTEEYKK